jgi:sucrose-6-phosphate hydrolase SacC (GH32 family)
VDEKGRTILWLWGRTNLPADRGWNGVMVLPRILSVGADGFLRQRPAPEFESLRREEKTLPAGPLGESPLVLGGVPGDALEVEAEFSGGGSAAFGFEVRRSPEGKPAAVVAIERGTLAVGNARTYLGNSERYKVRLFLDKACLEVYVNDGAVALYSPVAATPRDQGFAVFAGPGGARGSAARLESFRAWPMRPAKFDLSRFKV